MAFGGKSVPSVRDARPAVFAACKFGTLKWTAKPKTTSNASVIITFGTGQKPEGQVFSCLSQAPLLSP